MLGRRRYEGLRKLEVGCNCKRLECSFNQTLEVPHLRVRRGEGSGERKIKVPLIVTFFV
jgi:hypothetical protein